MVDGRLRHGGRAVDESTDSTAPQRVWLGERREPIEWQPVVQVFVVVTALDLASLFVPGLVGAQEGARMLATSMAGYGPELGLLFALVQRVEQLVWTSAGLGLYPALAARAERGSEVG